MTDPMMYIEQHVNVAGAQVSAGASDLQAGRGEDNELVATDGSLACGRCDQVIAAGQPMRRRASGGWAHEAC